MAFADPWGKLDRATGARHHLAHHCADVAASFLALIDVPVMRSRLVAAAGSHVTDVDIERLGVIVFIHDIGKLFTSFQAKGWPAGVWCGDLSGPPGPLPKVDHRVHYAP